MFEKKQENLLPRFLFYKRLAKSLVIAFLLLCISLGVGMWGYHHFESLSWVDAFVNAAMILSGMGPVNTLQTVGGKLFAGFYAIYSGVAFLIAIAIIIAPVFHRFLHKFHLQTIEAPVRRKNQ